MVEGFERVGVETNTGAIDRDARRGKNSREYDERRTMSLGRVQNRSLRADSLALWLIETRFVRMPSA